MRASAQLAELFFNAFVVYRLPLLLLNQMLPRTQGCVNKDTSSRQADRQRERHVAGKVRHSVRKKSIFLVEKRVLLHYLNYFFPSSYLRVCCLVKLIVAGKKILVVGRGQNL